jgi:5-methylcytosine-specific restriction endonuclease McrA
MPDGGAAAWRAQGNARRARKAAAQIGGPVDRQTYVAIAASGPCVYCGAAAAAVDHVRPLSRGGAEHVSNLVPACQRCNSSKNNRLLTEWDCERVEYGAAASTVVAAELARLRAAA